MSDQPPTIGALWRSLADELHDRSRARWLCETACGVDPDEWVDALDEPVTERMIAHLDAMLARYRRGEPLQYVVGRWGFRHLDLAVDRRVLIPRPETELVAEVAIARAREAGRPVTVVDLGTGSGAIGLAMASELPLDGTEVWLTDVDRDALDVARANLAGIGRAARNVRVVTGSWFEALPDDLRVDVVVSNPPYVRDDDSRLEPSVRAWEPAGALYAGSDGLDALRRIIADAPGRLVPGGSIVLEIGADQGGAVVGLLHDAGFTDVEVLADHAGHDRVAVGRLERVG